MSSSRLYQSKKYKITIQPKADFEKEVAESKEDFAKAPKFTVEIEHSTLDSTVEKLIIELFAKKKYGVEFIANVEDINKITLSIIPGKDFEAADLQFRNLLAGLPFLGCKDSEEILVKYKSHIENYKKELNFNTDNHRTTYLDNHRWGQGAY